MYVFNKIYNYYIIIYYQYYDLYILYSLIQRTIHINKK